MATVLTVKEIGHLAAGMLIIPSASVSLPFEPPKANTDGKK
jgi:hypothetical protein